MGKSCRDAHGGDGFPCRAFGSFLRLSTFDRSSRNHDLEKKFVIGQVGTDLFADLFNGFQVVLGLPVEQIPWSSGVAHYFILHVLVNGTGRLSIVTQNILDGRISNLFIPFAGDDIVHSLGTHHLRIWCRHHRIPEVFPDQDDLLQDFIQPIFHPNFPKLAGQVRHHAAWHLVLEIIQVIFHGNADREPFLFSNLSEMV